jgi:PAS domain S-box-containing protein
VASNDQLRLFIEKVTEYAIFTLDTRNRITAWNTGAERLLGWTEDEALGRDGEMIFTPEDRASGEADREIDSAYENGVAQDEREHIRKDGSRFFATGMLMSVRDATGSHCGYVKIMRDNTERRRAQQSLQDALRESEFHRVAAERANRAKNDFISTVSHELRTPLNNILLWSRLMTSGKLPQGEWTKGIRVIDRSANAQRQLIDDLLDISRMESGRLRLAMRPMRLAELVRSTVESVQPMLESRDLRVVEAADRHLGVVIADPERIQQVLWNLVANSIKFTPDGGSVRIAARREGDDVVIEVIDTGAGIRPDFLPFVFERFQQAEAIATRTHAGLGLGLAIAKQIVELHGGTITAASEGRDRGATFTVRLPLPKVNETEHQPASDLASTPGTLRDVHILLVEDDAGTREATRRLLELEGASVQVANDANGARDAYVARSPDIVLCDVGLPAEDGLSFIRWLRQIEDQSSRRHVPAVAVTAFARVDDEQAARASGFDQHLPKPVDAPRLIATIVDLVGPHRSSPPA